MVAPGFEICNSEPLDLLCIIEECVFVWAKLDRVAWEEENGDVDPSLASLLTPIVS